jgi:hypothetical protein
VDDLVLSPFGISCPKRYFALKDIVLQKLGSEWSILLLGEELRKRDRGEGPDSGVEWVSFWSV